MSKGMAAVLFLVLGGCSGGSSTPGAKPTEGSQCAQRAGTYVLDFAERTGGTCGAFPEQVTTITKQPTEATAPCTGTISYSPDNCTVTYDERCPAMGGITIEQRGTVTWSPDGTTGSGIIQVIGTQSGSAQACSSTYDVTGARR